MKLVVAIVQSEDAGHTVQALSTAGISVTRLASSGGFLHRSNATLLVGVDEDRVDEVVGIVRDNCRERSHFLTPIPPVGEGGDVFTPFPVEISVGGATVFVVPVDRFERI